MGMSGDEALALAKSFTKKVVSSASGMATLAAAAVQKHIEESTNLVTTDNVNTHINDYLVEQGLTNEQLVFERGYYVSKYGGVATVTTSQAGYAYVKSECAEGDCFTLTCTVGGDVSAYIITDADKNVLVNSTGGLSLTEHIVTIPSGASYIYVSDKGGNKSYKGKTLKAELETKISSLSKEEKSGKDAFGGYNATMRGKQISQIEYTTVADMEYQTNGTSGVRSTEIVTEGTTCKGMLYSSSQHAGGQLGIDVSLYTFLSAVQSPNSKVYTFEGYDYNGFLWYGSVCTGLVCHALGIAEKLPTSYFMNDLYDGFREVDAYDVRIGDVMAKTGHVRLVTMVKYDEYGRLTSVEWTESVHSFARTITRSFAEYMSDISNNGYHIVRYDKLKDVEYTPDGCVIMDGESTTSPTFPDILSDYGDKCVIHEGDDITFTVMDSSDYTSIEVYKDDVLLETKTVAGFTMSSVEGGKYEVRLVGTSKTSSCYFIAIDCTATYADKSLTFESTYGTLQSVTSHKTRSLNSNGVYDGQTACYGAQIFDNPVNSDTVDISYVFEHAGGQNITTGDYICLHMLCEYGRVEFKVTI